MDESSRKEMDSLFRMFFELDSELKATQLVISEIFNHGEEQREAFEDDIRITKAIVLKDFAVEFYDRDPQVALRIFGDLIQANDPPTGE